MRIIDNPALVAQAIGDSAAIAGPGGQQESVSQSTSQLLTAGLSDVGAGQFLEATAEYAALDGQRTATGIEFNTMLNSVLSGRSENMASKDRMYTGILGPG